MNPRNETESAILEIMLSEFGHKPVAALQNCMVRIAAYIVERDRVRKIEHATGKRVVKFTEPSA